MQKILNYALNHKWWSIITIVLVIVITFTIAFSGGSGVLANTFTVMRGDVISQVSVTGIVKPTQSIDLAFEKTGRISSVLVKVGDYVKNGQILLKLSNGDIYAQLLQANATLASEEARLQTLVDGARPEEIKAKELLLESAQEKLSGYYTDSINVAEDAYAKSNDAVKNKSDSMFSNDGGDSPQLTYSTAASQAKIDAQFNRLRSRTILNEWNDEIMATKENFSNYSVVNLLKNSRSRMDVILTLLTNLQDTLTSSIGLSQTVVDAYKTSVNTARNNVISEMTSISGQLQNINEQIISVNSSQNNLDLLRAGSRKEDVDSQIAKVDYAKSQVIYMQAQLEKTYIRAPFSGRVTKSSFDSGEIVSANIPVVSVIGEGRYQIEANITESDISRVRVGKKADVTLDAYGDSVMFSAEVINLDIGATIVEGVATYKATLEFSEKDANILPGLTANVDILNGEQKDVLYVPIRNTIIKNGETFIKKVTGENVEEFKIETGLRGSNGRIEVLSGLEEGDIIISE